MKDWISNYEYALLKLRAFELLAGYRRGGDPKAEKIEDRLGMSLTITQQMVEADRLVVWAINRTVSPEATE